MRSTLAVNRRYRTLHHQAAAFMAERLESRLLLSATLTTLASFSGTNGTDPVGGVSVDASGNLFGTTEVGGANGDGEVFEIAAGSQSVTDLADFNTANGDEPQGGVTLDAQGNLFGTASGGGVNDDGDVFEVTVGSRSITDLADFNYTNGHYPVGAVTLDASGDIFGTTGGGGDDGTANDNKGTVFEVVAGSNTITSLASFNGANGYNPSTGVILDPSGNLIGTTQDGGLTPGINGYGTVFGVSPGSGTITDLADFNGTNGSYPEGTVILDANDDILGTTEGGGANGDGEVFGIAPGSGTIADLADFNGTNGSRPQAGLTLDSSGNIFGTATTGGADGDGDVFEIAAGTHTITDLVDFNGTNGSNPNSHVTLDANGNLFGTTAGGGIDNDGTVFEIPGIANGNGGGSSPVITSTNGSITATGTSGADTGSITESNGTITVTIDSVSDNFPVSSTNGLYISLGGGNDSLTIGKNVPPVTIGGGAGADTIVAHNANDDIKGGKGADLLIAGGAGVTVTGGKGADTIGGGAGGGSSLSGGPGDDLFVNNDGSNDTINGGDGLNLASYYQAQIYGNIAAVYNAPAGYALPSSSIAAASSPSASAADVQPAIQTITDGVALDTLSTGVLKIVGTSGPDSISLSTDGVNLAINVGGAVSGVPLAGLSGVLLVGGAGNDTLSADSSLALPLTLRGGAGNDILTGGGGSCVLVGGAGNDSLTGGSRTSLLTPGARTNFGNAPTGDDTLAGGSGPAYADFSHRTDALFLSNDGQANSGDTAMGEATLIEPSVKNIFGGPGNDTIVSTTPGSFLSAGYGSSDLTSGGDNSRLEAGPAGAGSDSVTADGNGNVLFLMNGHADTYGGTVSTDILQTDSSDT